MIKNMIKISKSPNLKSILLRLGNWNYEFVRIRHPEAPVCGLTSKTIDNKHIICLDYDLIDKNVVLGDILMLKEMIKPSLIFLLTTHEQVDKFGVIGNYHILILDKFYFRETEQIMALTHSDKIHRLLANKSRYRAWVIRISSKGERESPKLLKVWQFKGKNECSYAHYLLLKSLYKFKINERIINFDKYTTTTLTCYNSASKLNVNEITKNGR